MNDDDELQDREDLLCYWHAICLIVLRWMASDFV